MRVFRQRRAFRNWPRLRKKKDGYVIQGQCMTVGGWEVCQALSLILVVIVALAILAASTVSVWGQIFPNIRGTVWATVADSIASLRYRLAHRLFIVSPSLGRALAPIPGSPIDWHLAALGAVHLCAARPLARLLAALLPVVLGSVVVKEFRITITPTHVKIARPLWSLRLPRDDDGPEPVRFRAVPPDEYYSRFRATEVRDHKLLQPLSELPPAIVEVTHGFKRYVILFARRADRADAIVSRCQEAMLRTRRTFPFTTG